MKHRTQNLFVVAVLLLVPLALEACAIAVDNSRACVYCPSLNADDDSSATSNQKHEDEPLVTDANDRWRGLSTKTVKSEVLSVKPSVTKKKAKTRWYAWSLKGRTNISRKDLAAAFKADSKKILRVPTATFIREIGSLGLPSPQDQEKFAEWILSSSQVKEVACTSKLLGKFYMSRASKDGRKIDMKWNRKSCYKGEKLLVYVHDDGKSDQPFLSLGCGNILTPRKKEA